jgi:hypothetical protein
VKVGHRQALIPKTPSPISWGFCFCGAVCLRSVEALSATLQTVATAGTHTYDLPP